MRNVPFDFCDECEAGKDRYPVDDLSHFGDDRLCPAHAAIRLSSPEGKKWRQTDHPGDFYDRLAKCEDDKQ